MRTPGECDRSGCHYAPAVRVRFTPEAQGGRWWYYCAEHAWPLDEDSMTWGGRGPRARRQPVHDVEHLAAP